MCLYQNKKYEYRILLLIKDSLLLRPLPIRKKRELITIARLTNEHFKSKKTAKRPQQ